ncbi:MAG: DUF6064 family protein [Rubrivivax sp.]|nr:DUF6064 family protein [Rubrivivax sp.]
MSEWWTYRPTDFLMFAPRTYWRLFELHNDAWWPVQPLLVLAALAWMAWLMQTLPGGSQGVPALRVGAAGLAAAWAFVAGSFLLPRYAPINWAASGFAAGFFVQALGLAALATRAKLRVAPPGARRRIGLLLGLWALLGHPLLAAACGRPWTQAEVFGLAPDPTAIATLGFLLAADAPGRPARWLLRWLWTVALAWCAISAATLLTMGSPQGWLLLAAGLLAMAAAWPSRPSA